MRRTLALAALLAACLVPSAQGHLLEQGGGCSRGLVPVYTSPAWVQAWASDPIDEEHLASDPLGHGLNSVGRVQDPCIQVIIPCKTPGAPCPLD